MKRILKYLKQNTIGFIVGGIVFGSFGVFAATVISATNVEYSDTNNLGATNVQTAIDRLDEKAINKISEAKKTCPYNKICNKLICRRATTLHTEKCENTETSGYCLADGYKLNDTITYGSLGTKGTLTTGDAFDCDVNGDGVYDPATERFYYVSDMTNGITQDSNIAVLIYYNNVSGGLPSNSTSYSYDLNGNACENGPITAISQLPSVNQWKNVNLINEIRNITDEKGTVKKLGFSYKGYAARFLTTQEISSKCGFTVGNWIRGELSTKCKYLLENTKYSTNNAASLGSWLENPLPNTSEYAWLISGLDFCVGLNRVNNLYDFGVRPAIEIAKTNILY